MEIQPERGAGAWAGRPRGDLICCSPGASHLTFKRRNAALPLPLVTPSTRHVHVCHRNTRTPLTSVGRR